MKESDIDPRFYNSETRKPFESCLVCSTLLQESGNDYFVERIFRRVPNLGVTEAIFEYGMCMQCAEQMRKELSEESREKVEGYFEQRLAERSHAASEPSMEVCLLTGTPIGDSIEFSYHGHCRGDRMIHSIFPYAVSDVAMEEISALLSDETIDQLDDFKGKYFTGPPEYADLLNPKRLIPL